MQCTPQQGTTAAAHRAVKSHGNRGHRTERTRKKMSDTMVHANRKKKKKKKASLKIEL